MKPASWPKYMVAKKVRDAVAYYWRPPGRDIAKACPVHPEPLGSDYATCSPATRIHVHRRSNS